MPNLVGLVDPAIGHAKYRLLILHQASRLDDTGET